MFKYILAAFLLVSCGGTQFYGGGHKKTSTAPVPQEECEEVEAIDPTNAESETWNEEETTEPSEEEATLPCCAKLVLVKEELQESNNNNLILKGDLRVMEERNGNMRQEVYRLQRANYELHQTICELIRHYPCD